MLYRSAGGFLRLLALLEFRRLLGLLLRGASLDP